LELPKESQPPKETKDAGAQSDAAIQHRVMVLNADPGTFPLGEQLSRAGCNVVADADNTGQAFVLTDSVLPDALVVAADSLEFQSVQLAAELIRDRQACALILLTATSDPERLAEFRSLKPDAILPLPGAPGILAAAIQTSLDAVTAARKAAAKAVERASFEQRFALASARAARSGSRFAVGLVEASTADAVDRLKTVLRQTDAVMAQGEWLVFLAEEVESDGLDALARRMARALADSDHPGVRPAAIGMALWNSPRDVPQRLLEASQEALEEAKRWEANRWRVARSENDPIRAELRAPELRAEAPPQILLQRMVGWLSLLAIAWVVANYSGLANAERLAAPLRALAAWITSLQ
jgi:AmiR/NasT family two-component response regulator